MDSVYDVILGSLTLRQCQNTNFNPAVEAIVGKYSGGISPQAFYINKSSPVCTFETTDLATGLGIGTDTFCSAGLHSESTTITIPFAKRAIGAQFAGAGANDRLNATYAYTCPTSITAQQNQDATMSVASHFYLPTGEVPVTDSSGQNLGSQTFVGKHTLGPCYITPSGGSSTQVTQVTGVSITPGINVMTEFFDGKAYPKWVGVDAVDPIIEITTRNFTNAWSYGPIGGGVDAVNIYLYNRAVGGVYVADATTTHIQFSFGASLGTIQSIVADEKLGTATIRLAGKVLTCDTTSAVA